MIANSFKQRIIKAIEADKINYPSEKRQARSYDINPAALSRIKKGETEKVISDSKWLSIARKLDVPSRESDRWMTAQTPVFKTIYAQLRNCQQGSISAILCDIADIGKSYTARCYVRENKNAVYIDCSQVKSKQKLIRKIAQEFGIDNKGRYADVYQDLNYYLANVANNPLVILDEAGDLDYPAFLELKALWNATEFRCGWYMMGADGLRVKIDRNLGRKKVGYTEIFSRFGNRYQRVTPSGGQDLKDFQKQLTFQIGKANGSAIGPQELYAKTGGSLRRIYIEIKKQIA